MGRHRILFSGSSGGLIVTKTQSTRILIERIQGGDEAAKNELYDRCFVPVLFLVRVNLGRKLRTKLESWDIAQEALMKSLRDLQKFRYETDDAFRRYLSKKVIEVIRDQADYWSAAKRDVNRERTVYRSSVGDNVVPATEGLIDHRAKHSPSEVLALGDDLNQLAEALDELADEAPEQWELIVQLRLVGRSLGDLAEERSTTKDAIKMKARRGMVRLASIFRRMNS